MHLGWYYTSWPNLVQIGLLYHIAVIGTIGQKSIFSMKSCVISWHISTNRTGCMSGNVLNIHTEFGSNRSTIQYTWYRNGRLKIHLEYVQLTNCVFNVVLYIFTNFGSNCLLYNIVAIKTIGRKSSLSMKKFCVCWDIRTKLIDNASKLRL